LKKNTHLFKHIKYLSSFIRALIACNKTQFVSGFAKGVPVTKNQFEPIGSPGGFGSGAVCLRGESGRVKNRSMSSIVARYAPRYHRQQWFV
jgi:hypothetical protein